MKKFTKYSALEGFLLCGSFFALAACGEDVTNVYKTEGSSGLEIAASADSLGRCDSTALGRMMFASDENTAYVCADSGWVPLSKAAVNGKDGADGTDGDYCTVKALSNGSGYKVICGGDSVGVIQNGSNGADGSDGAPGKDGPSGTSCSAAALSDGSGYKILCGDDSVGVVKNGSDGIDGKDGGSGCNLATDSAGIVKLACGTSDTVTLYKALCGDNAYDPAKTFCFEEKTYDYCASASYDPTKQFCQDGNLYALCGGESYDVTSEFCQAGVSYALCGGEVYDASSEFCQNGVSYALCGGKNYDISSEFCQAGAAYVLCNGKSYDASSKFCQDGSLYALCDGESYDVTAKFCQDGSLYSLCGGKSYDVMTEYCDGGTVYEVKSKFTDARDGKTYRTVKIGSQIWMAENLNYDYNQNTAQSYCYNNSVANCTTYGRLYTWSAAMDSAAVFSGNGKGCGDGKTCSAIKLVRGVCPDGWHLPDATEWNALEKFVANSLYNGKTDSVGYALKSTSGWTAYNGKTGGSDYFGFGALPAGLRNGVGTFYDVQSYANFWSPTEGSADGANGRSLRYGGTNLIISGNAKSIALSVRCVKD